MIDGRNWRECERMNVSIRCARYASNVLCFVTDTDGF